MNAGTAALDAPAPASGTTAAATAVTTHAASSRKATETDGRAVRSGDTGRKAPTRALGRTCETDLVASCTSSVIPCTRADPGGSCPMTITNPALPLYAADLERTC